ncbi:MAG: TspO protein [Elusimicrobia bacterium RIFOXYB2_FULL_48_7]|nr:MAG: TspO protein [Elusimicrobia bacterium RIFOXYB2_FULL_48_7]
MPKGTLKLIASIIVCQLAGIIGAYFTMPAIRTWYVTLNKPSFNPPNWIFGPVWTALYLLMGIALFLVWKKYDGSKGVKAALSVFFIQLFLNTTWSILFFGMRNPLAGLVEIAALWIAILLTILSFYKISKTAAVLLLPYILWVSFAAILNFYLWRLN